MQDINWEEVWKKIYERERSLERNDPGIQYWDKRASDFSENRKTNNYEYGRKVLETLDYFLSEESEVLDIGAGPGTFVIPFARKVKKVTALEPAQEMIKIMKENAQEAGIKNYDTINAIWQDVEIAEVKHKYDLVISSLVLWMLEDVWPQLLRMEQASKGCCCIVSGAGGKNMEQDKLWGEIMGDVQQPCYQEYPLIYNLLFSKRRYPHVKLIRYTGERSVESAVRHKTLCYSKFLEITPTVEERIRESVLDKSVNGKCRTESLSAVIWWNIP